MCKLKSIVVIFILINILWFTSGKIPDNIIKCYNKTEYPSSEEVPPSNIQILVEILRKIELNVVLSRDIRILTSMIYERYYLENR